MMEAKVASLAEFCADPFGKMVTAEHTLVWLPTRELRVHAFWGAPTIQDLHFALTAFKACTAAGLPKHSAFADARRITQIEPAVYAAYFQSMAERKEDLSTCIVRSANIASPPFTEQLRMYRTMVTFPFESDLFEDPVRGLDWLGFGDVANELLEKIEWMVGECTRESGLVQQVRRSLSERLRRGVLELSVTEVARSLNTSPRSLQRALANIGSSYREELRSKQVERAMEILATSDMKLSAVALEVGFQRLQNLSAAFKEATGTSPREWRLLHGRTCSD